MLIGSLCCRSSCDLSPNVIFVGYKMKEDLLKLTVNKDIISFGTQRIPTRNVASISIAEDPVNDREVKVPPHTIKKLFGYLLAAAGIAAGRIFLENLNRNPNPLPGAVIICVLFFISFQLLKSSTKTEKLYQVNLLTNGGSITALTALPFDFAERVLDALQSAISGNDHRPIYVDARTQEVEVGSIDMSNKAYSATNSPGAVVGDNTNSTVTTNVGTQGVQDVDLLIGRVAQIAQGQDRSELLARLDEIRAHLKDGSVSKDAAKSAYADLFARIGKYASGAKDIVELVLAVGKFL